MLKKTHELHLLPNPLPRQLVNGHRDGQAEVDPLRHARRKRVYKRQKVPHVIHHNPRPSHSQSLRVLVFHLLFSFFFSRYKRNGLGAGGWVAVGVGVGGLGMSLK